MKGTLRAPLGLGLLTAVALGPGAVGAEVRGAWTPLAPIPVQIAEIAGAVVDGRIYTGGGFTPGGVAQWFGRYDPDRDEWTALAPMPEAVHHMGFAGADGRVWLTGGYRAAGLTGPSDSLWAYDPVSDEWSARAAMPGRRAAHFLVALDHRLYVVGGTGDDTERMWIYDIERNAWSAGPGPIPREHLGAAATGGRVYVVAGRGFGRGNVGTFEALDPATGVWQRLPDMPGECGGCSAAATADGRVHVTGGESPAGTHGEHYVYDPASSTWDVAAHLPTPRHGIAAAAVDQRFFVIGGGRVPGLDYSDVVEVWSPPTAPPASLFLPVAWARRG